MRNSAGADTIQLALPWAPCRCLPLPTSFLLVLWYRRERKIQGGPPLESELKERTCSTRNLLILYSGLMDKPAPKPLSLIPEFSDESIDSQEIQIHTVKYKVWTDVLGGWRQNHYW